MSDLKRLNIGLKEASEAVQDSIQLEAFAYALMVKYNFRSSTFKRENLQGKAFKNLMRDKFCMGYERGKRCLANALEFGYLEFRDGILTAPKVYNTNAYAIRLSLSQCFGYQQKKVDGKLIKRSKLTIAGVMDAIRKAVVSNHTRKQTITCYTIDRHNRPMKAQQRKKLDDRLRRYGAREKFDRLSNVRVQTLTGTKEAKARRIMQELVSEQVVYCRPNFEAISETIIDPLTGREEWATYGLSGFVRMYNGKPCIQYANTYTYNEANNEIRYIREWRGGKGSNQNSIGGKAS